MKTLKTIVICAINFFLFEIIICCGQNEDISQLPVFETSTFNDIEGNVYKTIKIGNSGWLAENFKAPKTVSGDKKKDVFVYDNNNSNTTAHDRLFTWPAAVLATPDG